MYAVLLSLWNLPAENILLTVPGDCDVARYTSWQLEQTPDVMLAENILC